MKVVVLVEGSQQDFEKLISTIQKDKKLLLVDTGHCNKEREYSYLMSYLHKFSNSSEDVMLAKFSGRENLIRELGDDSPEMIVPISYNKNSKYYMDNPTTKKFLDLISIFE